MWCYYEQSVPTSRATDDPKSATAIVQWLLVDKRSDLVPVKGRFGASGTGMQMIKGCNHGEVREAGCHIREFCRRRIISCMHYVIKCD